MSDRCNIGHESGLIRRLNFELGANTLRIFLAKRASMPLYATVTELERFRCNACGEIFKAMVPEGMDPRKFDETAPAMVGLLKYGAGVPF